MKKFIYILIIPLLLACDDFLDQEPERSVTYINYWKSDKDFESALYGLQATFRDVFSNSRVLVYRDRGTFFDAFNASIKNLHDNNLRSALSITNSSLSWINEYQVIANANLILENLYRATDLSREREDFYRGQALAVRAYSYFYILRTWGDAPLILRSDDIGEKKRVAWTEVMDVVISDLKEAAQLLPHASELKNADGSFITCKQYPSKGMAWAVLSHAYAWKASLNNEPALIDDAILYADSVINCNEYYLAGNILDVREKVLFGNSPEGIFEIEFRDYPNEYQMPGSCLSFTATQYPVRPLTTPATKRNTIRVNNETIFNLYPDLTDQRREVFFWKLDSMANIAVSVTQGAAYIQKFKHITTHTSGNSVGQIKGIINNEILIRLPDIILLRAELKEKKGDLAGAVKDLNTVRERAKATLYNGSEDLKEAIARERDKELFLEGHHIRYFDIVRNGTYKEKLKGGFKTLSDKDVEDGALYFPVGAAAFNNNTAMFQTPYWIRNGYAI